MKSRDGDESLTDRDIWLILDISFAFRRREISWKPAAQKKNRQPVEGDFHSRARHIGVCAVFQAYDIAAGQFTGSGIPNINPPKPVPSVILIC